MLPELPVEVSHLWGHYCELARARGSGMAANAISYSEIDVYDRRLSLELSRWEVAAIRRVDDAVLPILNGKKSPLSEPRTEVDAADGAGVKGLLRGLGARAPKSKPAN